MTTTLIIGASGLVGRGLARALRADGEAIRCLARDPARVADLTAIGCEAVKGDICDPESVRRAVAGVGAVYIAIHTLSPQPGAAAGARFMDVEIAGLDHVVAACRESGVRRIIYVTSLGISADARSEWTRERWRAEQMLMDSGLDVTVVRPGMIVGVGGQGFDTTLGNARRRIAIVMGDARRKMATIALDDLVYYLRGVRDDPRAVGQVYDVGADETLSIGQLIDAAADVLGRPHPIQIPLPLAVLSALAPVIESAARLPKGAFTGLVDGMKGDLTGDPAPLRAILPRPPLTYRQSVERALSGG